MTSLNSALLIKRAILSEKTHKQMEGGIYTFLVDRRAAKNQIAKAIEDQFQVNVVRVNVLKQAGKSKRITGTRKMSQTPDKKKAIVLLKVGQKIDMLSPQKSKVKTKESKSKDSGLPKTVGSGAKKGLLSKIKRPKGGDQKSKAEESHGKESK